MPYFLPKFHTSHPSPILYAFIAFFDNCHWWWIAFLFFLKHNACLLIIDFAISLLLSALWCSLMEVFHFLLYLGKCDLVVVGLLLIFLVGNYVIFTYAQKTLPPRKKKPISKKKMKKVILKQGISALGE